MTDGVVERSGDAFTLRYERHLHHPVEVVWRALTDPAETGAWFGGRVEVDLREGGDYITYHATGDRVVDTIVRLSPPNLLSHTFWKHVNPESRVTYELEPTPEGCRLVLTHVLTTADLHRAAELYSWAEESSQVGRTASGWHRLLDQLEAVLDGTSTPWSEEDMKALQQRYTDLIG